MTTPLEITEHLVYKKLVNALIEGIQVQPYDGSLKIIKFFRRGDTYESNDGQYEILENGVYMAYNQFHDGKHMGLKWFLYCGLGDVDTFIPNDYEEREQFYIQLVFALGMHSLKKPR